MEVLCGGCGSTLTVAEETAGGQVRCPHCGRDIRVSPPGGSAAAAPEESLAPLEAEEDYAEEFLTKARLALRKKLLIICGSCNERLTVHQRMAGKVARCPACGEQIRIPAAALDEPIDEEEMMTDAGDSTPALDVTEGPPVEGPAQGEPPHRPPPDWASGEATAQVVERRQGAARKQTRQRALVTIVLAGALLAGLLLGYVIWGRGDAANPRDDSQGLTGDGSTPPGAGDGQGVEPPDVSATAPTPPVNPPAANPTVEVLAARMSPVAGDGRTPASLGQAFLTVTVRVTAGAQPLSLDTRSRGVVLDTVKDKIDALGVAAGPTDVGRAAVRRAVALAAGASAEVSYLFRVPADLAVAELLLSGVGEAPLPSLARIRPPAVAALAGTYHEAGRQLGFAFDDPVMEALRAAGPQELTATAEGGGFGLAVPAAGVAGAAQSEGDGRYKVTLARGSDSLDCHILLVADPDLLVLYLADKPHHQIVYRRK